MTSRKNNGFIIQGSILAITSIVVRIIGLIYRIPLQNIIGDEGMGYYSYAYEPYSVMLMLSYHGIPAAVSKLVSANKSLGRFRNVERVFKMALAIALSIGCITGSVMFFGSTYLASEIIGVPMCRWAMLALGPTLVVLSVMGVIRGFFQGVGTMIPTSFSQVIEQIVNAIVSIVSALYLFQYGAMYDSVIGTDSYAEGYGAAGGTIGTFLGAFAALIFLIFIFKAYSKYLKKMVRRDREAADSYGTVAKIITFTAVPLILNSLLFNSNTTIESIVFNKLMLTKTGNTMDSISALWGVFTGKFKVLVTVPISVSTALAVSIIPNFAGEMALGNKKVLAGKLQRAIRFGMIVAIPSAVGLSVLAEPIISMLFSPYGAVDVNLLRYGTIAVVLYSISTITNAALQGIGKERFTVTSAAVALVIHIAVLALMVGVFDMSIYGVLIAYICFALIVCVVNNFAIARILSYRQEYFKTFLIPFVSAIVMGFAVFGIYKGFMALSLGKILSCGLSILLGAIVYLVVLLVLKGVDEDELAAIPKGRILVRILKKIHLL
ncbi:MAG: polysaccharide biosynthesis protein [Lachnospiraceae bacterium]|nr:polysaccharide biosynthesis protein [Lachnospiraceae bacterium]